MHELHDGGLSHNAIGIVAGIWWGEPLSQSAVSDRLRRKSPTRAYRKTAVAA
jgi:hypothetical protein